ncbi:MAG: putative CRISPR-associated protein [Acidobacteriota bacterium]
MAKTIICTVGTSAAKKVCRPHELEAWVRQEGGATMAAPKILNTFANVPPEGRALREVLSAEIHSLMRMSVGAGDRVLLFASSTDDGRACALAVEQYLQKYRNGISTRMEPIEGLQVRDAAAFRRKGVVNFARRCLEEIRSYGPDQVILNATGGFKALVPYAVVIGMIKGVRCCYIFEQSEVLVDLPPLPVVLDRSMFEEYCPVFERIERETAIPRGDWDRSIPLDQRRRLEPMIEQERNQVTLSGFGHLLLDEVRRPVSLVPFLSRPAWDDCLQLSKLAGCDPFRFLDRVARFQEEYRVHEHINVGSGLRWLKPGATTDRYLVSTEGWRLLVWRGIREDEVGADYSRKVKVDPRIERAHFAPFTRMEFVT